MNLVPPLLLLHGVTNSARIWNEVEPLLTDSFNLIVPTVAGHRGGPPATPRMSISSLVDDVERLLDAKGLAQVHVAGNSMGGWMAIELARRNRALSVCALSPAGCWTPGEHDEKHATLTIRGGRLLAQVAMPIAPIALRSSRVRRAVFRNAAENANRLSRVQALEIVRDLVACTAAPDLLGTTEYLAPFDLPCPVTIAWSQKDRIFPIQVNGVNARSLFPAASYLELENVGHIPMIDDPVHCATVIRRACS